MPEIEALDKYNCPACGAQAVWNPARQALVCEHCGTEAPAELDKDTGKIREINLARTLREIPESSRGWNAVKRTVRCRSCNAVSVFDPGRVGQNCEFCGSSELVDYTELSSPLRPQSLLPFQVDETRVRESIRKWYASKWLAPGALKKRAMLDTVKGVYLPYWTFDADATCPWTADSGTYYYTTSTMRGRNGRMVTTRQQHVNWRPASGVVHHFFDDEPVPATTGVHLSLLRGIEPFPTNDLVPYDTAYLSGFVVEHYQVVLIDAAQRARARMEESLRQMCAADVPGDTYRNLQIRPSYSTETFKHILVPVWLLVYDYGSKSYQVAVNGYTGKIAGEYPKSAWKIVLLVLLALIVVAIVIRYAG